VQALRAHASRAWLALAGPLPAGARANLTVEALAALAYGVFFAAGISYVPVILRRLGAGADIIALQITLSYVGSLLAPLSLLALRRMQPLPLVVASWALARGCLVLLAFTSDPWLMLLVITLFWIGEHAPAPAYARVIQLAYPADVRGRAMALVRAVMVAALTLVTPVAGVLLDIGGHRALLPIAAGAGVIAALACSRLHLPTASDEPTGPAPPSLAAALALVGGDRRFLGYLLGIALFGLGNIISIPLFPLVQVDRLQLSYGVIGLLGVVQSLCWMLGFLLWGRVIDRTGPVAVMLGTWLIAIIVPLCYAAADTVWLLIPACIAQGLVFAGFDLGASTAAIALAPPGRVLAYAAVQHVVIGVRGMLAPLLAAALIGAGYADTLVFAVGIGLLVLAAGCFVSYRRAAP